MSTGNTRFRKYESAAALTPRRSKITARRLQPTSTCASQGQFRFDYNDYEPSAIRVNPGTSSKSENTGRKRLNCSCPYIFVEESSCSLQAAAVGQCRYSRSNLATVALRREAVSQSTRLGWGFPQNPQPVITVVYRHLTPEHSPLPDRRICKQGRAGSALPHRQLLFDPGLLLLRQISEEKTRFPNGLLHVSQRSFYAQVSVHSDSPRVQAAIERYRFCPPSSFLTRLRVSDFLPDPDRI